MPTPNLPAKKSAGSVAKAKQTTFINILKTDHKFDIIKELVDHMGSIKRAKKIKPQEKHRLLQNYYLALLSYCLPKMKVVEDNTDKNKKPMNFTINIGETSPTKKKGGASITIPTNKNKDGTYTVSNDPTD